MLKFWLERPRNITIRLEIKMSTLTQATADALAQQITTIAAQIQQKLVASQVDDTSLQTAVANLNNAVNPPAA